MIEVAAPVTTESSNQVKRIMSQHLSVRQISCIVQSLWQNINFFVNFKPGPANYKILNYFKTRVQPTIMKFWDFRLQQEQLPAFLVIHVPQFFLLLLFVSLSFCNDELPGGNMQFPPDCLLSSNTIWPCTATQGLL